MYTGISFRAQRLYGDNHADCEPLTTADTAAYCRIYGVSDPQEIEDREQAAAHGGGGVCLGDKGFGMALQADGKCVHIHILTFSSGS